MSTPMEKYRQDLLRLMRQPSFMPMRKRKLAKKIGVEEDDYVEFRHLLDDMAADGQIAELKHGKFGIPRKAADAAQGGPAVQPRSKKEKKQQQRAEVEAGKRKPMKNALTGRIEIKRAGYGFLLSDPPGHDLFVAEEDLLGAMSGDLVAVVPKRSPHGRRQGRRWHAGQGRPAGRVVEIIERARAVLVGTFYLHRPSRYDPPEGPGGFVVPDTRGVFKEVAVLPADKGEARNGDKVSIELIESGETHLGGSQPTGRVVKVFGGAEETQAAAEAVIANFGLRVDFPAAAIEQAEQISETIPEDELAQRADYTSPVTFTIDPEDAKDHDDAVAIRDLGGGKTELLVHIADVSHYVTDGSPIDAEARERATSVYLPGRVLPMLPQKLSNNMCSLKEGQLRLTLTAAITFSQNLLPLSVRLERSYIRSAAFLTYDRVRDALDQKRPDLLPSEEIYETLRHMRSFAAALRRKRLETGSIDLDLPEMKLLLDERGAVSGWRKEEHHWAHQLIEDFMLAANRAVAEYLVDHEIPGLFRVHEDPDPEALERFAEFVREYGVMIRPPYDRHKLKQVLERVHGKDYQHAVHLGLLTSLKQAVYSSECKPHFALNFTRYLHFTSPIRRYPDLVVHRALKARFAPGEPALPVKGKRRKSVEQDKGHFARVSDLRGLATHCSRKERDAAAAEEEVKKFLQIQHLKHNMKESHEGVITGVKDFGLFVELQDCYVEGLVRVQDLSDDYYQYFEDQHLLQGRRTRRSFRLGDKVSVRVVHIDLAQKKVGLMIV